MSTVIKRYEKNPFLAGFSLKTKGRQVTVTNGGNSSIVDHDTGEVQGTHVVTYKQVDSAMFAKLFAQNIAHAFDMTAAGYKAFFLLSWAIQTRALNKDVVILDQYVHEDFIQEMQIQNEKIADQFSLPTFRRGLNELASAGIIAPSTRLARYFINPDFIFSGNRIAFTTALELKESKRGRSEEQLDMLGDNNG